MEESIRTTSAWGFLGVLRSLANGIARDLAAARALEEGLVREHVFPYDGGPRMQIEVPRDLIPTLSQSPRSWFKP